MERVRRIAMWSGPRNISTALLRAWENRPDAAVVDEPLYAYYLHETGLEHPGRAQILEADETDWRAVVRTLTGPVPRGRSIWYQKHMAHHLLPHVDRGWLDELDHAFLIRDPREMLISLDRVTPNPRLDDTGLPQQIEILEHVERRTGKRPPILDSRDVLEAPEPMLRAFCAALELDFLPEMLSWPPGRRDTDGVWAPHWYANVERSTGFARYVPRDDALPEHLKSVYEQCLEPYGKLHELRLRP